MHVFNPDIDTDSSQENQNSMEDDNGNDIVYHRFLEGENLYDVELERGNSDQYQHTDSLSDISGDYNTADIRKDGYLYKKLNFLNH